MRSVLISIMPIIEEYKFEVGLIHVLLSIVLLIQIVSLVPSNNDKSAYATHHSGSTPATTKTATQNTPAERDAVQAASSEEATTSTAESTSTSTQQAPTVSWPMRGKISGEFGTPHQPWQRTHTGIDIVSGSRAEAAAIKPFQKGKVVDIVRSSHGLGDYVILAHDEHLTSIYAHLSRINVREGQHVTPRTTIGYEGSSGSTTGRHLHFEIRFKNTPQNPRNYIEGNPNE